MKRLFLLLAFISFKYTQAQDPARPKLVVGIVVDQMRWDFLYRFSNRYSADGFKRMLREGFSCENTLINYTPTVTAAGHTCVYTGSVPALHGIMGNTWFDREQRRVVYCTEDNAVQTIGSNSNAGKMSPKNLWSSTITDELRLATNFKSKTIAIALKDRGAILPGGHTSSGSYWFDNASGGWITSSYYKQDLPLWVKDFNARKLPDAYLKQNWNTLYPINTYSQSTEDSNRYENKLPGEDATFPHLTSGITNNKYESFKYTPYGDAYTFEAGKAAVAGEMLGKRGATDFLALSFSSPDYIGHAFGPNSLEVEDTYLRFDRELGRFLKHLDSAVGKGQYLVFLTADHGVAHNSVFLQDRGLPAGTFDDAGFRRKLNDTLKTVFTADNLIEHSSNYQVFLNDSIIQRNKLDKKAIKQFLIQQYNKHPGIAQAIDLEQLVTTPIQPKLKSMLTNGYNQKLSGDIQLVYKPLRMESWRLGSTHGLWNPFDAHIPLLWFGWKIKKGSLNREVYMTDIAPTIAALLKIQMPNASIGDVIEEVVR